MLNRSAVLAFYIGAYCLGAVCTGAVLLPPGAALAQQPAPAGPATAPAPAAKDTTAPEAASGDAIAHLSDVLMIDPTIEVLRDEGLEYGDTLEAQMFPGQGGSRWQEQVAKIYDTARMRDVFDKVLTQELQGDAATVQAGVDFFGSDLGRRVLSLENEARRTLMDDAAEDAAKLRFTEMDEASEPRIATIRRLAELSDLVEANVVGALNSNLAFLQGMGDAGAFGSAMDEEQMLSDVWSQEDSVRAETEDWLYPYLTLAYSSLSDEELHHYIAFSETAVGRKLNAATFAAFDRVFVTVSRDLGRAAAAQMQGQDI